MSFSSMYTGATGMVAHNQWLQVMSNNLANVNTVGYRAGRTHFETLMSQDAPGGFESGGTVHSAGQIGKGVGLAAVVADFTQGDFQDGSAATDLAIGGEGYFRVRAQPRSYAEGGRADSGEEEFYYTRAGNFRFDSQGLLRDPNGNVLQGYGVDRRTGEVGNATMDIQLPVDQEEGETVFRSDPRATSLVDMVANLDSTAPDLTADENHPFFALGTSWDGTSSQPLSPDNFEYRTALSVYDDQGNQHELNFYFDPAQNGVTSSGAGGNLNIWEYAVGVDPAQDGRGLASGAQGLMMMGTLEFNSAGDLVDVSSYTLQGGDHTVLSNWSPASFNEDGAPMMNMTFATQEGSAAAQDIAFDFGVTSSGASWNTAQASAAEVGSNAGNLVGMTGPQLEAQRMTSYATSSVTLNENQDGFAEGYLEYVTVDRDGVLSGHFSNGQTEGLYQVALYGFTSDHGLRREGGNLFSETAQSGEAIEGRANQDGMGTIHQSTLETSNVDMATEFSHMILGQRGFQANSKVITTSDQMTTTLTQMKR
ncbi:flagellar hook protein FlgE [Desulfohalovibrio reitneri]|uniref:flagellar hook protein FlgE n=1 Tax=Desulfohalovibrio reitneri TaxID=1307759 RepID=UPI0004A6F931|nr:flagellar hook protein FlgE [Desulfohalovibrio reitneri]